MSNFKLIKRVSVFFVLAFVLFFYNISLAQEQAAGTESSTKVVIKDVKIEKSDTGVKINANLFNPSANMETSPFTALILLENNSNLIKTKNEDVVAPFLIVSAEEGDSFLSLKPQESKDVVFSLPISRYAPNGNYRFSLQAINQYGEVLGRYGAALKNIGANQASQGKYKNGFLAFDYNNCKIVNADGKEFDLNEGPIFSPSQQPLARCAITNIGNETVTAYPSVEWKEYLIYGRPSDTAKKIEKYITPTTFKANETKKVEILLPKADKSQVYQALLSFSDSDGAARSFDLSLRWTIGGSSARIDKVSLASPLKNIYEKGETVSLSADYFGSMDLYWNRGDNKMAGQNNVKLNAIIKDSDGGECGRAVKSLPDISDGLRKNEIVDIVLEKQCKGVSYSVSFSSQDKVLSNVSGKIPKVAEENKAVNYKEIGIVSFFIIAFLALLFIQIKKKGAAKISLFCLFLGASFLFSHSASAKAYGGAAGYNGDWGGVSTEVSDIFYLGHGNDKPSENYSTFKVKDSTSLGLGYSVGIDFSDLGHPQMDVAYKVGDNGCGNVHSVYFRVSVQSEADGVQKDVQIRDLFGNGAWKPSKTYAVNQTDTDFQTLEIDPSVMNDFYYYDSATQNYKQRSNSKLIVTIETAVDRDETGETQFRRGSWNAIDATVYSSLSSALDASAKAIYTIPLNLPAPSAGLSLSGASPIDYDCKPTLNWTVNDVSSCAANGGWSGTKSAANGTHSETMANGITASTNYGLSCSQNLGSAIGTGTYTDSVTVDVNAAPTVDLKAKKWDNSTAPTTGNFSDSLTINSGDSVTFHWGLNNWSYSSAGVQSCEFEGVSYTSGTQKTISNITSSKTYNITCKNSCGYSVTDSVKITCANCNIEPPASSSSSSSSSSTGSGYTLTVNVGGNCAGSIYNKERSNSTGGIQYYYGYNSGDPVTLTATNGANSGQTCKMTGGWNTASGGNCAGGKLKTNNTTDDTCEITMGSADKSLSVSFDQPSSPSSSSSSASPDWYNLTFKTSGSGSGNATRYSYDESFGGWTQSNIMNNGDRAGIGRDWKFKLVPNPSSGSYFSSWSGCSSVNSDNECILEKNPYPGADKTVTATFNDSAGGVGGSSVKAYISARSTVVTDGNSTVVAWTSDNADSCQQKEGGSDTGWISAGNAASGNYTTANFTTSGGSRTYTIECAKGSQKSGDVSVTVGVGSDYTGSPSVAIWADPQSVGYKKTSKIKWMASNIMANQCSVLYSPTDSMNGYMTWYTYASLPFGNGYYAFSIGSNNTTGQTTGKLTSDTIYKIQCGGYGPSYTKVNAQTTVTAAKPVSNFTLANSEGKSLVATIVEGLSANSSSVNLALSGESIGNVNISGVVPAILSGAKAQFSSDDGVTWNDTLSIDIGAISQVKLKVINIPGATATGTYNVALTAKDVGTGGITKKLNVPLEVKKVSSEWKEF